MKIQSLHLENYRCFSDLRIDFDEKLTILVGVNGSGKTAILDALAVFLQGFISRLSSLVSSMRVSGIEKIIDISSSDLQHGTIAIKLSYSIKNVDSDIVLNFEKKRMDKKKLTATLLEDKLNEFDKLVKLHQKHTVGKEPLPIAVYYSSKRILNQETRNQDAQSEPRQAYVNAFNPQVDFSSSLAWFIAKASEEALEGRRRDDNTYIIPELSAVRKAISQALGEYGEPYVTETPPVLFIPKKDSSDEAFRIEQLSDGYRTMLALVMDLARRMAVANEAIQWSEGESILHSPGVVLIDEVELHLHPSWQQTVLPSLMEIFPNVQFIVTTHSPQVLTSISAKHIRILKNDEVFSFSEETEGAEAGRVLEDVLGVKSRPDNKIVRKLEEYRNAVYSEKWDTPEAVELKKGLEQHYGNSEPMLKELELHIENTEWERGL
ncbi:AAA family ATPase [Desulfosarcina sp. OttesenSCG-928-B08]|nr:AAA family ATPase [Desulfosarcina sp. OttesenSCG-928-B08]